MLPADNKADMTSEASNSEDLSEEEQKNKLHNLEVAKGFSAYVKISTMATEMSSKSANERKIASVIKRKPVL